LVRLPLLGDKSVEFAPTTDFSFLSIFLPWNAGPTNVNPCTPLPIILPRDVAHFGSNLLSPTDHPSSILVLGTELLANEQSGQAVLLVSSVDLSILSGFLHLHLLIHPLNLS
jgi:hypothetical protein